MCEIKKCCKCDKMLLAKCMDHEINNCALGDSYRHSLSERCRCDYHKKKYHTYVSGRRIYATIKKIDHDE